MFSQPLEPEEKGSHEGEGCVGEQFRQPRCIERSETVIEVEMIEISAGTFTMGSNDAEPHEQPQHEVYLDRFEIAKYAVSNRQYDAFLAVQPD